MVRMAQVKLTPPVGGGGGEKGGRVRVDLVVDKVAVVVLLGAIPKVGAETATSSTS